MSLQKWKFVHCDCIMRICSVQFCWRLHAIRTPWPWAFKLRYSPRAGGTECQLEVKLVGEKQDLLSIVHNYPQYVLWFSDVMLPIFLCINMTIIQFWILKFTNIFHCGWTGNIKSLHMFTKFTLCTCPTDINTKQKTACMYELEETMLMYEIWVIIKKTRKKAEKVDPPWFT